MSGRDLSISSSLGMAGLIFPDMLRPSYPLIVGKVETIVWMVRMVQVQPADQGLAVMLSITVIWKSLLAYSSLEQY